MKDRPSGPDVSRSGATEAYPAPSSRAAPRLTNSQSDVGGRSRPLTLAGIFLMVAGIGGLAASVGPIVTLSGSSNPSIQAIALVGGPVSALAQVAVYLVFWRAGFPHRSNAMTVVTLGISVSYALMLLVGLISVPRWVLLAVIAMAGILMLLFTNSAAGNRMLPRGFRVVPVVQFVLVAIGTVYVLMQTVVLGVGLDLSGVVYLGAGVAYVLLAANTRAALEAASVATAEQRTAAPLAEEHGSPRASPRGARAAAVSITLSVVGVVMSLLLMPPLASKDLTAFSLPSWAPATAIGLTGVILAAAIILAIVSRVAARRSIHHALLWAVLGLSTWLVVLSGIGLFTSMGERFETTSLYSQELVDSPATHQHPLPYGTDVVLSALGTREPVMIVTVEEPQVVTEAAIDAGAPEPRGQYIAVPVTIEIVDRTAAASGVTVPGRLWYTHDFPDLPTELSIPGYPALDALDLTEDGVHRVYDFYDTSDSEPGQGAYMWRILGPDSEGAFWGESIEDFIPLATSAHYGTWVGLKSTVTGEEVGRVTVNAPTEVTDAVEAASLPDPAHGAFFACEIVLEIQRSVLAQPDAAIPLPSVLFDTPRGTHYSVGLPPDGSVPGYPTMEEVTGTDVASEFTYYDMFDIPPDMADKSPCVMFLGARGGGLDYKIDFGPD